MSDETAKDEVLTSEEIEALVERANEPGFDDLPCATLAAATSYTQPQIVKDSQVLRGRFRNPPVRSLESLHR